MLSCRVPVPFPDIGSILNVHEHALAPQQMSLAAAHNTPPEAVTICGTEQPVGFGHSRLLSLPSFGKVVYNANSSTNAGTSASTAAAFACADVGGQLSQQQNTGSLATQSASTPANAQQPPLQRSSSLQAPTLEFDSQFESGNLQKAVQVRFTSGPCMFLRQRL